MIPISYIRPSAVDTEICHKDLVNDMDAVDLAQCVAMILAVMAFPWWKHFSRYWAFVWGILGHQWIPLTKASDGELW